VVDIGCGTGHKLVREIGAVTSDFVGVDQPSAMEVATKQFPNHRWLSGDLMSETTWAQVAGIRPRALICSDVIEHVPDPRFLLRKLRTSAAPDALVIISTPDRERLDYTTSLGPPGNPKHIREWSMDGFRLLVEAEGFEVVTARHLLPRAYSLRRSELNRTVWRLLHRKPVPDRRFTTVLVLRLRNCP
jgi:SAM-dependent methyltransferase